MKYPKSITLELSKLLARFSSCMICLARKWFARSYRVLTHSDFVKKLPDQVVEYEVIEESTFQYPRPLFEGNRQKPNMPDLVTARSPSITVREIKNAEVMGNTDLVFCKGYALHSDDFKPSIHYCFLELLEDTPPGGYITYNSSKSAYAITRFYSPKEVDAAISLLGECPGNYAHWLLEILPKLIAIDEVSGTERLPLLVDEWIHPVFFETLAVCDVFRRPIITVARASIVKVGQLFHISPTSFTPPDYKNYKPYDTEFINTESHILCPQILVGLRERVLSETSSYKYQGSGFYHQNYQVHRFVYLMRRDSTSGNVRGICNLESVELILKRFGFFFVDTGSLTFVEQTRILESAEVVVAASGASLLNLMFTKNKVDVICLSAEIPYGDYYYFSQIMFALGHNLNYVLGPQIFNRTRHWLNRDYYVDLKALQKVLNKTMLENRH